MAFARAPRNGRAAVAAPGAGTTIPILALGENGTIVLDDGSLVHILAVYPRNFDVFTDDDRAESFATARRLVAGLEPGQVLQLNVEGDIVAAAGALDYVAEQIELVYGFRAAATSADDAAGLDEQQRARWGAYRMLADSLARGASADGWMLRRRVYVIARTFAEDTGQLGVRDWLPGWLPLSRRRVAHGVRSTRTLLAGDADVERGLDEHRALERRALRRIDAVRAILEREGAAARLLDGAEVGRYLRSRISPRTYDWRREDPAGLPGEVLSSFDSPRERATARAVARDLRDALARGPLDFTGDLHCAAIDEELVRTLYLDGAPSTTHTFWLAALTAQPLPFTLTVYLHGLDRRAVREEAKIRYHLARREVEDRAAKGRRDAEHADTARASALLVDEMAADPLAGLVRMSVYLSLRAPSTTDNRRRALADAVAAAQDHVVATTDGGRLNLGHRRQEPLWRSTLPLADNVGGHTLTLSTDNAADTLPLIGASFGSPRGLPVFLSRHGEVQLFDAWDRAHRNASLVVAGQSGSGKTMWANRIVALCVMLGARAVVFDRAGHFEFLAALIPGSRIVRLGRGDDADAINPWDLDPGDRTPTPEKIAFLVELHRLLLERDLARDEQNVLAAAIRKTYGYCAREDLAPRERELVRLLEASARHGRLGAGGDGTDLVTERAVAQIAARLALELREYVGSGMYAGVWDRPTTVTTGADLTIVDYDGVPATARRAVMFKMIEFARAFVRRVDRAARAQPERGDYVGRSVVLVDEAYALTGDPATACYLQEFARQARHLGTLFMLLSQDARDFQGPAEAVLTNASHRAFFRQDPGQLAFLRDTLGLQDETIDRLGRLRKVDGRYAEALWMNGGRGHGFVRSLVSAAEHWAFTSDPIRDVPLREAILSDTGDPWAAISRLAREHGLPVVSTGVTE